MEAIIKFNIIEYKESDWNLGEYAQGKIMNLSDEHILELVVSIVEATISENGIYYDLDDAVEAVESIMPMISPIILNRRCNYLRKNYSEFVELISYLTLKLA